MSWQDIDWIIESQKPLIQYDEVSKVKYFRHSDDQWISYDDTQTIKDKVDYANAVGYVLYTYLLGT